MTKNASFASAFFKYNQTDNKLISARRVAQLKTVSYDLLMKFTFPLLLALHIPPAIVSVFMFELYPVWILAAVIVPCFIAVLGSTPSKPRRLLACFLSFLAGLGTVSLLTAFYLQGEGFNERFFYHFNIESLKIGFDAYLFMPISGGLFLLTSLLLPWFLPQEPPFMLRRPKTIMTALGLGSVLVFPPSISAGSYLLDSFQRKLSGDVRILREYREVVVEPLTSKPKNLILIYAESLERLWFDEDVFPGLMATLNPLREQALEFTNTHQVDGTGWTMAGIVASQCSLPFNIQYYDGQEAHAGLAAVEEPFKNEICLGDILDAYGYETVFMGGAPLFFAGKGSFLKANGFDQTLGFDELKEQVPEYWLYRNGWGLYDDTLMDLAEAKIDELAASEEPFHLSVLTVDTHQPAGYIPKNCNPYDEDNEILHAVHCNDRIVGDFIKSLLEREDLDDTLIVLMSDHLALRNTAWDRFSAQGDKRRLSWMIWGDDVEARQNDAAATHFDVTPTLLEMMDIPNYHENNWGRSVLSGADGYWFSHKEKDKKQAEKVSYLDMEGQSAKKGIVINSENKNISIGTKVFKASRAGFSMNDTIFMLLMSPSGAVDSILVAEDVDQFNRVAKDYTVIAVSLNNAIAPDAVLPIPAEVKTAETEEENDAEGEEQNLQPPLYYYVGTPSKSVGLTGVVQGQIEISGREMRRALKKKAPRH